MWHTLKRAGKKYIFFKQMSCKATIGPYDTVILKFLRSSMILQFVTLVSPMLTYPTSYLCKPEHTVSKVSKKVSKEAYQKNNKAKLYAIGDTFLTEREISTQTIKRVLSLPMRNSNIDVMYVPTGLKKIRTRIYVHLILLRNTKIDQITFIQFA